MSIGLTRRLIGEGLGSAFLLAAVVGSGIMADRLFAHEGLALLANSLATGAALVMLIYCRCVHHGGLLVHGINVVRQPCRHDRPSGHRHVRRHPSIDVPAFVEAQVLGGLSAALLLRWLTPSLDVSNANALAASGRAAR